MNWGWRLDVPVANHTIKECNNNETQSCDNEWDFGRDLIVMLTDCGDFSFFRHTSLISVFISIQCTFQRILSFPPLFTLRLTSTCPLCFHLPSPCIHPLISPSAGLPKRKKKTEVGADNMTTGWQNDIHPGRREREMEGDWDEWRTTGLE